MDIQPFFTEEEKKQFFSKYKQLLRHLYSFLKKEDLSKMKELMKRVVALDCYETKTALTACSAISTRH